MFSVKGLGVVPGVVWGLDDDDVGFEEDEVYEDDVDDSDDDYDPYEKYEEYDDQ